MKLDIRYIINRLSETNGLKKSNPFISQLKILEILNNARRPLTRRDIIKKYCEEYKSMTFHSEKDRHGNDIFPTLNKEVEKRTYGDWFRPLIDSGLMLEVNGVRVRAETASHGKIPPSYKIDPQVSVSIDGLTKSNFDINEEQAISTIKTWLAICEQFSFFPLKAGTLGVLEQIFPNFKDDFKINDWIQTTSVSNNIGFNNQSDERDAETLEDKLWRIAEAITYSYQAKISFVHNEKQIDDFIPCLLKEHKGKWYVLGFFSDAEKIKIYPYNIYNISAVEEGDVLTKTEIKIQKQQKENLRELYKHSLGIFSTWHNSDVLNPRDDSDSAFYSCPLRISFKVKDGKKFENIKYLKMDPIHYTQEPIGEIDDDGYATVNLTCFPDADLVREIRKIGLQNVKDITCEWVNPELNDSPPDLKKWVEEL